MEKLRRYVTDNKILCRMIALYTIVCMSIILLTTTVMYSRFSTEIRDEIFQNRVQSLKQISNTVSFRAEYASYLMTQIKTNQQTAKLFYSSDFDVILQALDRLDELRQASKQLHSIYVYNQSENRIYYSGENRNQSSSINTFDGFEDRGFIEMLNNIENYPKYTPFLRMISVESPNGKLYETYVYTYLSYDAYSSGEIRNIVALNFHLGWVKDALNFISTTGGAE